MNKSVEAVIQSKEQSGINRWFNLTRKTGAWLLNRDRFTEPFQMRLNDGQTALSTWTGSICSMSLLIILLIYTYLKVDILIERKDVNILSALNDSFFDGSYKFGASHGFNVAVGMQEHTWITPSDRFTSKSSLGASIKRVNHLQTVKI